MFAVSPCCTIGTNASTTPTGIVRIGISALRTCSRNTKITSETIAISSSSVRRSVSIAPRSARSGRRSAPPRRPRADPARSSSSRAFTRVDHAQRVLAVAHHDDPADRLALAVELGEAAARFGAERDLGDVLDVDGRALLGSRAAARGADPRAWRHVAAAADRVLVARELEAPARPRPGSTRAPRGSLRGSGSPRASELVRVDLHLVLAHEAADRGDLGDAGHARERVAQVPVLERCAARRGRGGRCGRRARTRTPSRRRSRRARARARRPSGSWPARPTRYSSTRLRAQ